MIVELPGAVRVQIPPGCDAATIQAVLQAASALWSGRTVVVLMFAGRAERVCLHPAADMRKSFAGLGAASSNGAEANGRVGPSLSIFQSPPQ